MKIPTAATSAVAAFEALLPKASGVAAKKMFGQPAAFAEGNLFFGVYGPSVLVRLGGKDLEEALRLPGARLFEPMPGRAMKNYVVLPPAVLRDRTEAGRWVARSLAFARSLPAKATRRG